MQFPESVPSVLVLENEDQYGNGGILIEFSFFGFDTKKLKVL